MEHYTIRDVENVTGIKAHTLRIWEQRYNILQPKRKDNLHRIYDIEDLKHLLRIAYLYHNGWKISKIDALEKDEILKYIREANSLESNYESYANRLLEAAIDFNEPEFKTVLNIVIDRIGFEKCISELCYPFLQKIRLLWPSNNVIPSRQYFSRYIIQNRIILETDKLGLNSFGPQIVLLCPNEEFHALPMLFINYLFRKKDWNTIYIGSGLKLEEIRKASFIPDIKSIYIHLITKLIGFEPDEYFAELCRSFPDKRIIVSGEGIKGMQRSLTNLQLLKTDKEIYDFIAGE
jgi:DNA-binding transcriptional MerR regulator